jgi:hypothetical protein
VKKVDFVAFFSVFCYINPILCRIYRFNYQEIMHKSYFYIFPQKKLRKNFFFLKKLFLLTLFFSFFGTSLHFQSWISDISYHAVNKPVRKNDSHERLVSNEWSNVANKKCYHKKKNSAANGTFPIFPNFPAPGKVTIKLLKGSWLKALFGLKAHVHTKMNEKSENGCFWNRF